MQLLIPPALGAVLTLSIGALIVLLFTVPLSRNGAMLTTIGTVTLLLAMLPGHRRGRRDRRGAARRPGGGRGRDAAARGRGASAAEPAVRRSRRCCCSARPAASSSRTGPDLLSATLGLETLSLSAVTLIALSRGRQPLEAAFKYFVLASISFAVLLFGLGLVYLATGSFAWPTLTSAEPAYRWLLLAGVLLVGLGFAYELALVPLHFGTVDAYTAGAPALSGFVMAASKIAAVIALSRLIGSTEPGAPGVDRAAAGVGAGRDRADLDRLGHLRGDCPA